MIGATQPFRLAFQDPVVEGGIMAFEGDRWFRVSGLDGMEPFFMSLVSDADHWMFLSSNGALTAGRRDPDTALFPYHADDRIHDSVENTGSRTLLRVLDAGGSFLWEPFSNRYEGLFRLERNLYKNIQGTRVLFEEINLDLGLAWRCAWSTSNRFGFLRTCRLENRRPGPVRLEVLDGLQNVLPWGLGWHFQLEFSTLCDGYKRTERLGGPRDLALFRLSSIPADRPEPSEALRVNTVWSCGLEGAVCLLSTRQVGAFRRGRPLVGESDVRGRRGAYLLGASVELTAGGTRTWAQVADVALDAAQVEALAAFLAAEPDPLGRVEADAARGRGDLERLVAGADGLQATGDERSVARHYASTLFNLLRGGVPVAGYQVPRADFEHFVGACNRKAAVRHRAFLEGLPEGLDRDALAALAAAQGDPVLERLAREYLPLTFSRRHGDPSRPWNRFSIPAKGLDGSRACAYEGNWRDLFQNWEALAFSYPAFLESMIFKFLDASTADGHNPYRVTREGFEWEVLDPQDPWSFIGYWGDHQVIYLLKLLEAAEAHAPGSMAGLLDRRLFTYADVPYRIQPFDALLADPRRTIHFDVQAHAAALARVRDLGADGLLLARDGEPCRASLAEKLLVVALARLGNFIPGAGIWMNTQRPEWNDANNALVGPGVSVVTLAYLRRFLVFCRELFLAREGDLEVAEGIAQFLREATEVLEGSPVAPSDPEARMAVLRGLGEAASRYRERVYARTFDAGTVQVGAGTLQAFWTAALRQVEGSLRSNRRDDGLYHAYNLMKVEGDGVQIRRLYPMLEGQVAILASGLLAPAQAAALLEALRRSALWREDQGSYLLYPDRELPRFLEKNIVPETLAGRSPLLKALEARGDARLAGRDLKGNLRFAPFRSRSDLEAALAGLRKEGLGEWVDQDDGRVLEVYEMVFDHQSFTGRSGTFFKYEGLGCIYWHMVSKLLLAADEVRRNAWRRDPAAFLTLQAQCREIREGLGVHRSPAVFGAIPTDPYSHTPSGSGAQQPGMTGQVKEDFLARFSGLGVEVAGGRIRFRPDWIPEGEFLPGPGTFRGIGPDGSERSLDLQAGSLAFTLCQVPVVMHRSGPPRIGVRDRTGRERTLDGLDLDLEASAAVFGRSGDVQALEVHLGLDARPN